MFRSRALPFDPRTNKIASLQSLKFHHGGLCEEYVSALNRDIADTPIQNADLFTIITQSFKAARGEESRKRAALYDWDEVASGYEALARRLALEGPVRQRPSGRRTGKAGW